MDDPSMKRLLLVGLLALGLAGIFEPIASASNIPPGIGATPRRVGRVQGYWKNPTRGPLYDYSSYFATMYPYLPGAQEYQWQGAGPGQFVPAYPAARVAPGAPPVAPARP
jgi:hypothetical protein